MSIAEQHTFAEMFPERADLSFVVCHWLDIQSALQRSPALEQALSSERPAAFHAPCCPLCACTAAASLSLAFSCDHSSIPP